MNAQKVNGVELRKFQGTPAEIYEVVRTLDLPTILLPARVGEDLKFRIEILKCLRTDFFFGRCYRREAFRCSAPHLKTKSNVEIQIGGELMPGLAEARGKRAAVVQDRLLKLCAKALRGARWGSRASPWYSETVAKTFEVLSRGREGNPAGESCRRIEIMRELKGKKRISAQVYRLKALLLRPRFPSGEARSAVTPLASPIFVKNGALSAVESGGDNPLSIVERVCKKMAAPRSVARGEDASANSHLIAEIMRIFEVGPFPPRRRGAESLRVRVEVLRLVGAGNACYARCAQIRTMLLQPSLPKGTRGASVELWEHEVCIRYKRSGLLPGGILNTRAFTRKILDLAYESLR